MKNSITHIFWLLIVAAMWVTPLIAYAEEEATASTEEVAEKPDLLPHRIIVKTEEEKTKEPLVEELKTALDANRIELKSAEIDLSTTSLALQERELLIKLLRSKGYYASSVIYSHADDDTLEYEIMTGPAYHIRLLDIVLPENAKETDLSPVKLKEGDVLEANHVFEAINQLRSAVQKANCFYEVKVDYDAEVFHDTAEAELILTVADSPQVVFGALDIKGTTSVKEEFITRKISFKEGECFKRNAIDKTRINLLQSALFSTVDVTPEKPAKGEEAVRMHVQLGERKHRTLTAGGGFSTDQGVGVSAGWEHRNFFGGGQKLELDSKISSEYLGLHSSLTIPAFMRDDQALEIGAELVQEQPDAYDSQRISFHTKLSRKLSPKLKVYVGGELKISEITDTNGTESYALFSFPSGLELDHRDDALDPTKGFFANFEIQPFFNALDTNVNFLKTTIGGSTYFTLEKAPLKPTFAIRAAMGTMQGVNTDDIPADERYYSGGSGSVRGYGYQLLGPLDGTEPIGGRSLAELSLETRLRFSESWGGVIFFDGGNAFDDYIPEYGKGLQWAFGVGARYYTDFAPIRLDIAVPLDRRDEVDDAFQFYISIGQAF